MKKRGIVPRPPPTNDQIVAMQGQQIAAIQRQMMQSQYLQTQPGPGTTTVTTVTNTNVVQPMAPQSMPGQVVAQPNPGMVRAGSVMMQPGGPMTQPGMPVHQPGLGTNPSMINMAPQQPQPVVGYMNPSSGGQMQLPNVSVGYVR
jgi:hypothetical protein